MVGRAWRRIVGLLGIKQQAAIFLASIPWAKMRRFQHL
jgi:hypothetical protein